MASLDYFPPFKYNPFEQAIYPRKEQIYILDEIDKLINSGCKTIFIQAPPGVGKSPLAVALLKRFGGRVVTSTKSLQSQYIKDFPNLVLLKGRSNFNCVSSDYKVTCDIGMCLSNQETDEEMNDNNVRITKDFKCKNKPKTISSNSIENTTLEEYIEENELEFAATSASRGDLYWNNECDYCEYWSHKIVGMKAHEAIFNYKFLMLEANNIGDFGAVKIMISDEGHNIEKEIASIISAEITKKQLDKVNRLIERLNNDFIPRVKMEKIEEIEFILTDSNTSQVELFNIHLKFVKNTINTLDRLIRLFDEDGEHKPLILNSIIEKTSKVLKGDNRTTLTEVVNYVMAEIDKQLSIVQNLYKELSSLVSDYDEHPDNWIVKVKYDVLSQDISIDAIEFNPIFIKQYAYDKYFRLADINIIMSATILDYEKMAINLGFDPDKVGYIEVDPIFPAENNKVFLLRSADLKRWGHDTSKDIDDLYSQITERIDVILDLHPNDKGLVHCGTNQIAALIGKYTRHPDRILTHNTANRNEILLKHKESLIPTVLVSPSMTEGVDLPDDMSRFQVFVKIPYANLGDTRIKKRTEMDRDFYDLYTAMIAIQAIGRSIRSNNDHATTYLIDKRFERFLNPKDKIYKYVNPMFNRFIRNTNELFEIFPDPNDYDGWWVKTKIEYNGVRGTSDSKISQLLQYIHRPWRRKE